MNRRAISLIAIVLVAALVTGCVSKSNLKSTPPEVVREVNAYKDGHDGIRVSFVLTDKDGNPTASDGTAILNIGTSTPPLYSKDYDIHTSDFKEMTVGQGVYAKKVLTCSLGFIPYAQFSEKPYMHGLDNVPYRDHSQVTLYFKTPDGKMLRGVTELYWE
jgi:hypothetical protein